MNFTSGELVRVISPNSLKSMNIVGILITEAGLFCDVWIPDLSRSICFEKIQLEKII
jgi:hypothetical protein